MATVNSCVQCKGKILLINSGKLLLHIDHSGVADRVKDHLDVKGIKSVLAHPWLQICFESRADLQRYISLVESQLTDKQMQQFSGRLLSNKTVEGYSFNDYPLSQLSLIIENPDFVKIIQEKLYQSFIQPVINTKTREVAGYEFLLRPASRLYPFSPGDLFMFARHSGLQSLLDSQTRINAIRTASHMVPEGKKLFINFLPSSIYNPEHCLKSTFKALKDYDVKPQDIVFEVVESEKIRDLSHLKSIFAYYKKAGVKVALDDIGAGYSTIEVLKELKPDYAKIDRRVIQNCHKDPVKMFKIKKLREITKEMKITLLAEGIESEEEFKAVEPVTDLVQGYYFGRPLKKPC